MEKKEIEKNEGGVALECLITRPEKVAIVALGSSCGDFTREMIGRASRQEKEPWDEIWAVNRGLRAVRHDKLFVMDDLRWLKHQDKHYAAWLRKHDCPIITSTAYAEYPMAVEYPLHEIMEFIKDDIFTVNTISYMVAYAMYTGVRELSIFGADFFYPDGNKSEEGGQAVAYLLGMATGMGMVLEEVDPSRSMLKHKIPNSSTLLYANKVKVGPGGMVYRPPYGYHRKEQLQKIKAQEKARNAVA